MRFVLVLTLTLALALALLAAGDCPRRPEGTLRTTVTLVWGAAPAHAAAALLRAALIAGGAPADSIVLQGHDHYANLCDLFDARPRPLPNATGGVVMALATAWQPVVRACSWDQGTGALRVQGAGATVASARLHARLVRPYDASSACEMADAWPFYDNVTALRECGFVPCASRSNETQKAVVYVLEGEWEGAGKALRKGLGRTRLHFVNVSRAALADLVFNSKISFLFLDAELWHGEEGVRLVEPPPAAAAATSVSLRVADEYALRIYAPALHAMFAEDAFKPRAADIRAVLESAADFGGIIEAASHLANSSTKPNGFDRWREKVSRRVRFDGFLIVCDDEAENYEDYRSAEAVTGEYVYSLTCPVGLTIRLLIEKFDCRDDDKLSHMLFKLKCRGELVWTAFVVASAALLQRAAPYAEGVPLLAYDVAAVPPNATVTPSSTAGHAAHLALALRRLLNDCGWQRFAVVSEPTPLSATLMAALRVGSEGLALREENTTKIYETLHKLVDDDARVFFVNADSGAAAAVLAAARELNLTPAHGYAWIVREYGAADDATKVLQPYSVSFQWRGPTVEAPALPARPTAELLRRLENRWAGRAWPRHAAHMIDAILTLAEGYVRLVTNVTRRRPEIMEYRNTKDKLSYLWKEIRNKKISGIVEDMAYDNVGEGVVAKPTVYVDRWSGTPRPRRLATWRDGDLTLSGECPGKSKDEALLSDGSSGCIMPSGDAFYPSCNDVAWGCSATVLLLVSAALALAARRARRELRCRDARIRTEVAERILARRSVAFVALAPHLVERAAIELREELGAGRFGRVRLGLLRAPCRDRPVIVAVKALQDDAAPAEETQFLKEACTLAALDHEHVVRFAGVCVEDGPPLLLMEHAFFGDLRRYLVARRHLAEGVAPGGTDAAGPEEAAYVSAEALTRLAHEAAAALTYLAARGFVHRDVRASNCLVDARRSLKLADFGLARETGATDGEYACRGRAMFPVLWMAPESLEHGVCSAASDVWAFGVLALELVTLGARPYGDASPPSVVRLVLAGGRPPLPRDASPETRALARACWRRDPTVRPPAACLAAWLVARHRALRPALAVELHDVDADSGFGEPPAYFDGTDAPLLYSDAADPPPALRGFDAPLRSTISDVRD